MTEGFLEGGHVVGHVWGVGELGGPMHEVVHGCPAGVPVGEVEIAMALVVVAWGGNELGMGVSPRGKVAAPQGTGNVKVKSCPSHMAGKDPAALGFWVDDGAAIWPRPVGQGIPGRVLLY